MKTIKYVLFAIIIFLCAVTGSELYQSYLQTFTNQFYFIEIENDNREVVETVVMSTAEKYDADVFAIERKDIDAFHSKVIIYATEDFKTSFFLKQGITEGIKNSFFSGSTEVKFCPFDDVAGNKNVVRYYFTGTKDVVSSIRQSMNAQFATSYIHKEDINGSEYLIYGIWIISFGFILLLTWLDIQFSRKADFLKISMGASTGKIIAENIIKDLLATVIICSVVYWILYERIFVAYRLDFAIGVMLSFLVFNSLLYVSILKYDYKEIIYGANINVKLLANTYLLKAVVMIMLVISLSCNMMTIFENVNALQPYYKIDKLNDYNTLMITPNSTVLQNEISTKQVKTQLYYEAYSQDRVLLSTSCASLEEPIIVVNEKALNALVSNQVFLQEQNVDFIVCIPESKEKEIDEYDIEFAVRTTNSNFFGLENYTYEVSSYAHTEAIYFDLRSVSDLPLGFEQISDPVMVYCNISANQICELMEENTYIDFGDRWANIVFDIQDISVFSEGALNDIEELYFNNLVEQCSQYKDSLIRTVLINSMLSIILLVLSVLLVGVIVKIEYLINSKEIAIKKIMGYSILERNKPIILLNVFAIFIAIITGGIISKMYEVFDVWTLCTVSLFVFGLDTILILSNMAIAENKNTAHILKGGSL